MDAPTIAIPEEKEDIIAPSGRMVAFGVSAEDFDEKYAADFHERVRGIVIKMAPVSEEHDSKTQYLNLLLNHYLAVNPIAVLRFAPFMLRNAEHDIDREPDMMLILNGNPGPLTPTMMKGVPDIVVEIVSKESRGRDYGDKMNEYERLGVPEYWIIDPLRKRATFYRLSADHHYDIIVTDSAGVYQTPLLPKLQLNLNDLFRKPSPNAREIFHAVEAMFAE